jgi:hypothetical protein
MNSGSLKIKHTPSQGKVIPEHNQIQIVFPNGYSASIVYGGATYSTNLNGERFLNAIAETDRASTVEIAVLDPQGEFVKFRDGESVKGFATLNDLLAILNWVSTR